MRSFNIYYRHPPLSTPSPNPPSQTPLPHLINRLSISQIPQLNPYQYAKSRLTKQSHYFINFVENWLNNISPQELNDEDRNKIQGQLQNYTIGYVQLNLNDRVQEVLKIIRRLIEKTKRVTACENTEFLHFLLGDLKNNMSVKKYPNYFDILNKILMNCQQQFAFTLTYELIVLVKQIRLQPNSYPNLAYSIAIGDILYLLLNSAFLYGSRYPENIICEIQDLLLYFSPNKQSQQNHYILYGRTIIVNLVMAFKKQTKINISKVYSLFSSTDKCILMGFDLSILMYMIRQEISEPSNSKKLASLIKLGVCCIWKMREFINTPNKLFDMDFSDYLQSHQSILKHLKMPFTKNQPELILRETLRGLTNENPEEFQLMLKLYFTTKEREETNLILNSLCTSTGTVRKLYHIRNIYRVNPFSIVKEQLEQNSW